MTSEHPSTGSEPTASRLSTVITETELDRYDCESLKALFSSSPAPVVLWPLGSVEPHGPHLPLSTDRLLSEMNAQRAAVALNQRGIPALVAPAMSYGVTDFAAGFTGAISITAEALESILVSGVEAWLDQGAAHVCLINHHLEPGQLQAIRAACEEISRRRGDGVLSAPCVISRRWGKDLGEEFRQGACHAGAYETSLVLAAAPALVDQARAATLRSLDLSLSEAIATGAQSFQEIGMSEAYTGAPCEASAEEGERLAALHAGMVVTTVTEALQRLALTSDSTG